MSEQDHEAEAYKADRALLHEACARRLLRLCQSNGGVYIKAAQLLSTAQTAPAEYRKYAPASHGNTLPLPDLWVLCWIQSNVG